MTAVPKHILLTTLSLIFISLLWHALYMNYWTLSDVFQKKVWFWGDSQLYQSFDNLTWSSETSVWLDARHGYGFQDLISYAERLPLHSESIVSFGPLFYRVHADRNQGGLCKPCISVLFDFKNELSHDYPLPNVLLSNVRSEYALSWFKDVANTPYPDTVNHSKRLDFVQNINHIVESTDLTSVYAFKDSALHVAIQKIEQRADRLMILSLPVSNVLHNSSFLQVIDHHQQTLTNLREQYGFTMDTITITCTRDPFYDATHFNAAVLDVFNEKVCAYWQEMKANTILSIQLEQANSVER